MYEYHVYSCACTRVYMCTRLVQRKQSPRALATTGNHRISKGGFSTR